MAPADISVRRIGIVAGSLALAIVAAGVAAFVLLHLWDISPGGVPPAAGAAAIAGPTLEAAPQPDLRTARDEKLERLHSSGWIDQQRGIAHITIDDAITRLVASGAQPRSAPSAGPGLSEREAQAAKAHTQQPASARAQPGRDPGTPPSGAYGDKR